MYIFPSIIQGLTHQTHQLLEATSSGDMQFYHDNRMKFNGGKMHLLHYSSEFLTYHLDFVQCQTEISKSVLVKVQQSLLSLLYRTSFHHPPINSRKKSITKTLYAPCVLLSIMQQISLRHLRISQYLVNLLWLTTAQALLKMEYHFWHVRQNTSVISRNQISMQEIRTNKSFRYFQPKIWVLKM